MKRVLVAIDMNDESNSLIRFVFPYAERHNLHHIDFIHVEDEDETLDVTGDPPLEQGKNTLEKIGVMVDKCMETLPSKVVSFNILITRGIPEEEIVKKGKGNALRYHRSGSVHCQEHRGVSEREPWVSG